MTFVTKMRWRIKRDYQELKQDFGLGHCEDRGWRGFHHYATLSIAAYAFLMAQRHELSPMDATPQSYSDEAAEEKNQPTPGACRSRGSRPSRAPRAPSATFPTRSGHCACA